MTTIAKYAKMKEKHISKMKVNKSLKDLLND